MMRGRGYTRLSYAIFIEKNPTICDNFHIMTFHSHNREESFQFAQSVANMISHTKPRSHALVIALEGELGAGKTTFTQDFCKIIGISGHITSPTFVIMKSYPITWHHFTRLIHIDAYRLHDHNDLIALGIQTELENPENIILIEWPERVAEILPQDKIAIHIDHINEHERTYHVQGLT